MKKRNILISIILIFYGVFTGCGQNDSPLYPIPTLQVEEGLEKGFDLSVYKLSPQSELRIENHPRIVHRFFPNSDSLFLKVSSESPGRMVLKGWIDGQPFHLLVRVKPMVKHRFEYGPKPGEESVIVMGGFNDWSRTELNMDRVGDRFVKEVVLKPQRHEYKFVVDGEELIDPGNPVFVSNNIGGWNSILDLSDHQEKPAGRLIKVTQNSRELVFDYLSPGDGSLPAVYQVFMNNTPLHNDVVDFFPKGGLSVKLSGLEDGLLRITGMDDQGRVIPENHTMVKNGRPIHPSRNKEDWHFTVLYSLVTDRFLDGKEENMVKVRDPDLHPLADWHGGDLAGIIQKLEEGYFNDLGVTSLWLSPLQRQPDGAFVEWIPPHRSFTGYHGYWPVASRELDPRYGTEEELKKLVALAHNQGIKVILDFVSNHVHENHSYYKENQNWFGSVDLPDGSKNIRRWGGDTRLTTWFDTFLPSYDYPASPEAIDQVTDDALWWLETFDLDGFRQDAVKHVPHSFWKTLTQKMKSRFPEKSLYQIGESFGSDELIKSYVNPAELSSQFNFSIYFNARGPFKENEADFNFLMGVILNNIETYGPTHLMGNITSSHDQVRFSAFADEQLTFSENGTERAFIDPPVAVQAPSTYSKLANFHALNISLPGVPVLYYGDEIALMGAGDPDNRRPMKFELNSEEKRLKETIGDLNQLRSIYPSLSVGDFIPLSSNGSVLAFLKVYFDEVILVVINHSLSQKVVNLDVPIEGLGWTNLVNKIEISTQENNVHLKIPPHSHGLFLLNRD